MRFAAKPDSDSVAHRLDEEAVTRLSEALEAHSEDLVVLRRIRRIFLLLGVSLLAPSLIGLVLLTLGEASFASLGFFLAELALGICAGVALGAAGASHAATVLTTKSVERLRAACDEEYREVLLE